MSSLNVFPPIEIGIFDEYGQVDLEIETIDKMNVEGGLGQTENFWNEDEVFDENRPVLTRKLSNLKTNEESIETLAVCNMPRNESINEILLCAGTSKGNIIIWNLMK